MRAIAHPLRMMIVKFIHEKGRVNVNRIYNSLGLEQSITSQHLKILRDENLVMTTREGKFIYYSLNYDDLKDIVSSIEGFTS